MLLFQAFGRIEDSISIRHTYKAASGGLDRVFCKERVMLVFYKNPREL